MVEKPKLENQNLVKTLGSIQKAKETILALFKGLKSEYLNNNLPRILNNIRKKNEIMDSIEDFKFNLLNGLEISEKKNSD